MLGLGFWIYLIYLKLAFNEDLSDHGFTLLGTLLLLIGFTLVVESLHQHIPKGYIYFAMGFAVFVEVLNLRLRHKPEEPVKLRTPYAETAGAAE